MRSAPSVNVPVGRSRFWGLLVLGGWGLGLADLAYWCVADPRPGMPQALTGVVLAACGALAWLGARRQPEGRLAWDGAVWSWSVRGVSREVALSVACDLQRWILVRLCPTGRPGTGARWLWLEAGADPADWLALRRAVYSPATPDAQPEGPATTP
ncbi:hypothetical protein ACT80S_08080 [Ramlibacter sp. MAHUQ-53]|uniref:hypothetical protein n=1 Tax=unclassified Ramlibacter TaxID=2617605 RepID=UPI0036441282